MDVTLYSATEALRGLLDQIDPESGEMPEGFEDARAVVATKATSVAAYIIENGKQAEYLKEAAKELTDRARSAEKRNATIRNKHQAGSGQTIRGDEQTAGVERGDVYRGLQSLPQKNPEFHH